MPEGPLWRFVITDDSGAILTFLDRLASGRSVNYELNRPATASGTVPSDNPEINIVHTDGDPFLAINNRFLYGFRREATDPDNPWVVRFAGVIMTVTDEASTDQPFSNYTAYDPWQYLYARPVFTELHCPPGTSPCLPGKAGLSTLPGETGDQFILRILGYANDKAIADGVPHPDCFIDWGQAVARNTPGPAIETCPVLKNFKIDTGSSLGEAFDQITATGVCDIILSPIYDPINRPGLLAELNIYRQAGIETGVEFQWDAPVYATAGISRQLDGTQMVNVAQFYNGRRGTVFALVDNDSIDKYGQYWSQQIFPTQVQDAPPEGIAAAQIVMKGSGQSRITLDATPEIASPPFTAYFLGDQVLVTTTDALRAATSEMMRVYGIPIEISDNALEQVNSLLVGSPLAAAIFVSGAKTKLAAVGTRARVSRQKTTSFFTSP